MATSERTQNKLGQSKSLSPDQQELVIGRPWFVYLFLIFCALLAIVLRGYAYCKEDQNLYLPFVLQWNDPSLYPHDHLLTLGFARESITWGLIALCARWIPLPALLAILWAIINYLQLLGVYKISVTWWRHVEAGWVAVFLWVRTYQVPGVANSTFDDYFTTRILGTLFGTWALYFFFRGKSGRSAAAIALGYLSHVISVLPLVAAVGLTHVVRRKWKPLLVLGLTSIGAAMALMAYAAHFGVKHDLFAIYSGSWLDMVRHAAPELFPQQWQLKDWRHLGVYLAIYYAFFLGQKGAW